MTRTSLPDRRRNETFPTEYRGSKWVITVGFDDAGNPREVFANGPKEGSDMQHVLSDACVVISIALQHGIAAAELMKSIGSIPTFEDHSEPASPIGIILKIVSGASTVEIARAT